jgi:hypothetical protein
MFHIKNLIALSIIGFVAFLGMAVFTAPASADWNAGDPTKMLNPQLPDPHGWDVRFNEITQVADDWICSETGAVDDIHFWYSWKNDLIGSFNHVHVIIYDDVPASPTNTFSHPGNILWARAFEPTEITTRLVDSTDVQGWLDPPNHGIPGNHVNMYQANIENIHNVVNPFIQREGHVYWLGLMVYPNSSNEYTTGWKTSLDHFNDGAVYVVGNIGADNWAKLSDPFTQSNLDMAFIITPEPGTITMLVGCGLIAIISILRRRRIK